MWNGKYISIISLVEQLYRDNDKTFVINDLNLGDIAEWTYTAMGLIGVTLPFINRVTDGNEDVGNPKPIVIQDYMGELPCDLYTLNGVREYYSKIPLRESSYVYQQSANNRGGEFTMRSDMTYTINNDIIYPEFKEGLLELTYRAFPIDKDGLPLIPDNVSYIEAIKAFIVYKIAYKEFISGRMAQNIYNVISQDWEFYSISSKNRMMIPSMDKAESMLNRATRFIKKQNYHNYGFKYMDDPQMMIAFDRTRIRL